PGLAHAATPRQGAPDPVHVITPRHRTALAIAGLYLAGVALPVVVVAARNVSSGQGFVLLTANMGPNLLLGNNERADGLDPFPPEPVARLRRTLVQQNASQIEVSRAASRAAFAFIRAHPRRALALALKKIVLFYNQYEIPNDRSIRAQVARSAVLRWPPC